jgi:hypothetical protein
MTDLAHSRSAFVRQYRADPRSWPDGIGAWYRADDWLDDGTLVATGEARARAIDPWANDRAKGLPCPDLPDVTINAGDDVTINPRGRPATGSAMTSAERVRLHRARKGGAP